MKVKVFVTQSCLTVTPWATALQAPLSMEFSRQEYFSRGSSQPMDQTQVFCIAGTCFTIRITSEFWIYVCMYIYMYSIKTYQDVSSVR